jgi:hypothetical protein
MDLRALERHASTSYRSLLKLERAAAGAGKSLVAAALLDELPAQWTAATVCLGAQTTSLSLQLALQARMEKRNKARPRPATCQCLHFCKVWGMRLAELAPCAPLGPALVLAMLHDI